MSDMLFAFTLGPVQTFIAEARRASDLYMGSRILADMTAAAALAVRGELIFPTRAACTAQAVPNRFIALITDSPKNAAIAACMAAKKTWDSYGEEALKFLKRCGAQTDDATFTILWNQQTSLYLEFYWVACPFDPEGDYVQQFDRLQQALAARKRTRGFEASEEIGQKDSLSGMRAGLTTSHDKDSAAFWGRIASSRQLENRSLLKSKGERLDAIGALKRFGGKVDAFPSTSTMAAVPFLLAAQPYQAALDLYTRQVDGLGFYKVGKVLDDTRLANWLFDGDALFLETFTVKRLEDDYGLTVSQTQVDTIREALRELYNVVRISPRPYFAVLKMDGDHVGERLAQRRKKQEHHDFSDQMRQFAAAAKEIVNHQHAGRLMYSGGDDVLALASVDEVLPMAKELRDKYRALTGGGISAGIAIAHHLSPLDRTLAAARQAEHVAKTHYRQDEQDAVHVAAFRRSGETLRVGTTWEAPEIDPLALFEKMRTAFRPDGPLSPKLAYTVADELPAFDAAPPEAAHEAALKRLIKRHREAERDPHNQVAPESLARQLNRWAQALDDGARNKPGRAGGATELAQWLLLARFVAGGGEG